MVVCVSSNTEVNFISMRSSRAPTPQYANYLGHLFGLRLIQTDTHNTTCLSFSNIKSVFNILFYNYIDFDRDILRKQNLRHTIRV